MNKLVKALYMLGTAMLSTVGMGQYPGEMSVQNVSPTVIEENTPLYLEHATVINQQSAQQRCNYHGMNRIIPTIRTNRTIPLLTSITSFWLLTGRLFIIYGGTAHDNA